MAWHHHIHHAAKRHALGFAGKHPVLMGALALVGVVAVAEVAMGKHATPSPATQNKTPPPARA